MQGRWYFWSKPWRQEMEFLFPDIFIPRLDAQTDQNVSVRPKPAVLWPDAVVELYGAVKRRIYLP